MNRWLGLSFGVCFGVSSSAVAGVAHAQAAGPAPASEPAQFAQRSERDGYSDLEKSVIQQKLSERGLTVDPAPDGKVIEDIQIVTLDVFDERDPMPDFVNVLHATTDEPVIRRELLFREGEPYRASFVHETARNLRGLQQLSIVLIVPAKGTRPDRVRMVVITKDVWSLRLNWALELSNSHITSLVLNPSEENLFGTHAVIGGMFIMDPATYSLGFSLGHRRLLGSHQQITMAANVIKNRYSGATEGSFGEFRYGQPLYSLDTKWSWGTSILWRSDIARRFVGVNVDTTAGIPVEYNRDRLYGGYQLIRSFGRRFKYDISVGFEADRREYSPRDLSGYSPAQVKRFIAEELPLSDQRIGPFAQLHAHRTDYRALLEVETLGLQEDYRRGHDLLLRMYGGIGALGSTRDLLGSQASLAYTQPVADGFIRPVVSSTIEWATLNRNDALFQAAMRIVSPHVGFARLMIDAEFFDRYYNYLNRHYVLGGDNRLRGYAPGAFPGSKLVAVNTELRTTSIDILSAQVGGAAFYDVGDAKNHLENLRLKQSVGIGVRVLFPEFDRIVMRADWGFPLSPGYNTFPGAFFLSFGQAFNMPSVPVPSVLTETF
ncbi:MAG TPA: BamA/TamA family outer membrane protein [Polyangiaceae bacterium]|nr:BamA/TamA family outer membrane protein [Polyangiaceae bacterium]